MTKMENSREAKREEEKKRETSENKEVKEKFKNKERSYDHLRGRKQELISQVAKFHTQPH